MKGLTPRLTGAVARSAEGTNTGHENGEAMASVGVRVEPPVRHFGATAHSMPFDCIQSITLDKLVGAGILEADNIL